MPTVRRYLKSGRLPKVQPGGERCRVLIPRHAVTDQLQAMAGTLASSKPQPTCTIDDTQLNKNNQRKYGPTPRWQGRR